jgi:hypothetical protein
MFSQEVLHTELARRVQTGSIGLGLGLPQQPGEPSGPALRLPDLDELAASQDKTPDVAAIAVLDHFDLTTFVRSALEFAFGVSPADRDVWFRAFTRTLFLAGNPSNLTERFSFDHIAADGSVAWFGPTSTEQSNGLRRLLKLFDGDVDLDPPAELTMEVPGRTDAASSTIAQTFQLHLATAGVTLAQYLVHLNHVLAEAVLTNVVKPGDRLVIHHVPRIDSAVAPYSVLRVHLDNHDPTRLRAYASLSGRPLLNPAEPC